MPAVTARPAWPYVLWAAVGVLIGLAAMAVLTIGPYVLLVAAILAVVGLVIPASRSSAVLAAVPGVGILPLLVALNNMGGPGERCWTDGTSSGCSELLDPWPFAIPAVLIIGIGCWLAWRFGRPAPTA